MPEEQAGQEFNAAGRLSSEMIQAVLTLADYDCYLCGPPQFMQGVYNMLVELGISDQRIFAESFGPASLNRIVGGEADGTSAEFEPVEEAVVHFETAQFEQAWTPADGTLLEFAEAHGLSPNFGCRSGTCGSCAMRLVSGKTAYSNAPKIQPEDGQVLICCAVPARSDEPLRLEL